MIQKDFAYRAASILPEDPKVLGLAVAGSWISNELDEFSDLDLILVTQEKVSGDITRMMEYAKRLGTLLSGLRVSMLGNPGF